MTAPKQICLVALLVVAGVLGFGAAPRRAGAENKSEGTDRHGDLLPPGALARLGTVRFRTPASWLAFLPGDTTLLAAGAERLSVWDVATGKELRHCPCEHGSGSHALAPDGKTLAVGTYTNDPTVVAIHLRDADTGRVLQECRGHAGWVRSLAFAADGRTLVSGSHDGTVRFWDVATGKELRRIDEPDMVMAVALAPDGKTVATSSMTGTPHKEMIRLRDAATGRELRRFEADMPVFHLAFSPDGKTLVALEPANGGKRTSTIHLWDVASGKLRHIAGQPEFLYSGVFSPDSKTLATGSEGGIVLWDVATAKETARLGGKSLWTSRLTFSGDGKTLASLSQGTIRLWDVATGKERPAPAEGPQAGVQALRFLPDGKTLASAGGDLTVRFWEAASGRETRRHLLPSGTIDTGASFAPDGSTLTWRDGRRVAQLDATTGKPLRSFDFPEVVYFFAASPDGKLLAAYGRDRALRLLDQTTGKEVRDFPKYDELVCGLVFSPDARTLAVGVEDNTIRLVDTTTGKERRLPWPVGPVAFAFSPDGKTLAAALSDNSLTLVEVATGEERLALGTREHAASLAFSPNGRLLAVGTTGGTIELWELATGKEVHRLKGHRGSVTCLAFASDGRRLASGGIDTTALTWDVLNASGDAPAAKLSPRELEALGTDLAGADAARAYRAIRALVAAPEQAVPFLRQHWRPVPPPDRKHLARLIADLDADQFAVRERAALELGKLGPLAWPALRQALAGQPSLEVRQQAERLLQKGQAFPLPPAELGAWRALEVLEHLATREARSALEEWGRGAPEARQTEEARAALGRLARRTAVAP
jgi:WD40 repeat protein